ncbi:hypothetical protein LXL04_005156 [Taraxacum kok-saghyz]
MGGADQEEECGSPVAVNRGDGGGEREVSDSGDGSGGNGGSNNNVDSAYQHRYDLQQVSRWIEQILPFYLLLLIVFIRQHLQGTKVGQITVLPCAYQLRVPALQAFYFMSSTPGEFHRFSFGYSDKPQPKYGFDYTLDGKLPITKISFLFALGSVIDELRVDKVSLVVQGSFAPIVVKYASNHQEKLNDLILLNPPVSIHPTFSIEHPDQSSWLRPWCHPDDG